MRKRKITTLPFMVLDFSLLIYFVFFDAWLALFLIPVISEYFAKKYSLIFYIILLFPLVFQPSVITLSMAYSILLTRMFGIVVKNFGRGDVKVLQTIAVAIPVYLHLPVIDSLFPPVLAIVLVASILGTIASLVKGLGKGRDISSKFQFPRQSSIDNEKFWVNGTKRVYKIPFVTFIAIAYVVLFILSLLRLV